MKHKTRVIAAAARLTSILLLLTSSLLLLPSAASAAAWPVLKTYEGEHLRRVKMPLGGIGTGTISLTGRGSLVDWEIRGNPAKDFTPICEKASTLFLLRTETPDGKVDTRLLEGPLDSELYEYIERKAPPNRSFPRYGHNVFRTAYPFAQVEMWDDAAPVRPTLEAMNPMIAGDSDASGIPAALLRWRLANRTEKPLKVSLCAFLVNAAGGKSSRAVVSRDGFTGVSVGSADVKPTDDTLGRLALMLPASAGKVTTSCHMPNRSWTVRLDHFWRRFVASGEVADWTDPLANGSEFDAAAVSVAFELPARGEKSVPFALAWRFPHRYAWSPRWFFIRSGAFEPELDVGNWYATQYADEIAPAVRLLTNLGDLESRTAAFVNRVVRSKAPEVVREAALFNLSTFRTETCFRTADGHFFGWEGCQDQCGSCHGSCTHVWGYEHALVDIWPDLARDMLEIQFGPAMDPKTGHMGFRVGLPLAKCAHRGTAAADGQMQCVIKAYEYWKKSGDTAWLKKYYPNIRKAVEFCWIAGGWDADRDGVMEGSQHNTMDVNYYGPNPQMEFLYLAALKALAAMSDGVGETAFAGDCRALAEKGSKWTEANLFNGEYYEHHVQPSTGPVAAGLGGMCTNDPPYQLAAGCLVDQLVGDYAARAVGLGPVADEAHAKKTLDTILVKNAGSTSVGRYNCGRNFTLGDEPSLKMAWYPKGRMPKSPFPYYGENMTGFEYVVAASLAQRGDFARAEKVVRDIRSRFDGKKRNPFNEPECGHHYVRANAAWSVLKAFEGAAKADALVADPYRAVEVAWPKYEMKGKDFWLFLNACWHDLPGVSEEPFVQQSGLEVNAYYDPFFFHFTRTISIRNVKALDEKGKEVPAKVTLTCAEKDSVSWTADDGSLVVSCDKLDIGRKYLPAVGAFTVTAEKPFATVQFNHGTVYGSHVEEIVNLNAKAETAVGGNFASVRLAAPVASLTCELKSKPWRIRHMGAMNEARWSERMKKYPFYLFPRLGYHEGLNTPDSAIVQEGIRCLQKKYPDTFACTGSYEWDSNFLQKFRLGPTSDYLAAIRYGMKIPCNRTEMADNMYGDWQAVERANGRGSIYGMSGCINFMQLAADFGAKAVGYELTEGIGSMTRIQHQITYSAGRQFRIPTGLYMAYFAGPHTADSWYSIDPAKKAAGDRGTDWGTSPSYSERGFYLGYYMGNNFLTFESQPSGQTILTTEYGGPKEKARYALTGNGKVIKDMWEWSEKPEGKRGEWYAPILLLKDRASISDGKYPLFQQPYAFYGIFPATDGDGYVDMVDQLVSPYTAKSGFTDPSSGTDLVNSEFADIFTSYIANPLCHGEVKYADIAMYPVIFVLGDMNWSETLANTMVQYVAGGGTLVLTAAQADPFSVNFLGYQKAAGTIKSKDGLLIQKGTVAKNAEVVRKTSDGHPLFLKTAYKTGRVIYVTSPNFTGTAPRPKCYMPPKELKELLLAVQDEVVPFKVRGNCEAVYNRLPDGTWKLLLVNNNGLSKATNETEQHLFPEYTYDITLSLPKGATAKEVRSKSGEVRSVANKEGGTDVTLKLPPAGVLVVEVKGIPQLSTLNPQLSTPPTFDPVRNFVKRSAPTGLKNDGFRYDPDERWPKEKAPELVGEWLAKNNFRDSSGGKRDLKVVGPITFHDGVATFAGDKPIFAHVSSSFKPTLYEGTIETWVKLDVTAKPFKGDKRGATFGVFGIGDELMLMAQGGRWALASIGPFCREDIYGPKVTGEWTHLAVAFAKGEYNLYVNGVKVKDHNGPLRGWSQGKDTFFDVLSLRLGSLEPSWGFYFRGDIAGARYLSRRLSDDEIKALAAKRW